MDSKTYIDEQMEHKNAQRLQKLIETSSLPEGETRTKLDLVFDDDETLQLFFKYERRKKEWEQHGFHLYESNPDKIIVTHKLLPGYILKMVSPLYINDDKESELLIQLNLSRVFVANEIKRHSKKFVTAPKKFVYYVKKLKQWIVVSEFIDAKGYSEERLLQLREEQIKELFRVCEQVGFQDLAPRNMVVVDDKIIMIDTEDFIWFEDQMEALDKCEQRVCGLHGLRRKIRMYDNFKLFSESLEPKLKEKYTKLFKWRVEFLGVYEYFKTSSAKSPVSPKTPALVK